MNMRKFAFLAAIALTFGVLAALPGTAQALTIGDNTNYLGSVGDPEPASPSDEEGYINTLIAQAPGSTQHDRRTLVHAQHWLVAAHVPQLSLIPE